MIFRRPLCLAAALLAGLLLASCAARLQPTDSARIRTVAVLNLVPDAANLGKPGVFAMSPLLKSLGAQSSRIEMGGRLDAAVVASALGHLRRVKPEWQVKTLSVDRGPLIALSNEGRWPQLRAAAGGIAKSQGVDALVVLTPYQEPDGVEGLGVTLAPIFAVTANLQITVVDADGKTVAESFGKYHKRYPVDFFTQSDDVPTLQSDPALIERFRGEILEQADVGLGKRMDQLFGKG